MMGDVVAYMKLTTTSNYGKQSKFESKKKTKVVKPPSNEGNMGTW
jgi:hypothetical protein